jgi:hypothetical protein
MKWVRPRQRGPIRVRHLCRCLPAAVAEEDGSVPEAAAGTQASGSPPGAADESTRQAAPHDGEDGAAPHGTGQRRVEGARGSPSCHHGSAGKDACAVVDRDCHHGAADRGCRRLAPGRMTRYCRSATAAGREKGGGFNLIRRDGGRCPRRRSTWVISPGAR